MTKEQAVKWVKFVHDVLYEDKDEEIREALNMAIEALSTEATTGDYPNDLISRNALMEYCSNQKSKSIDNNDIARFPSAEARPTGKWIKVNGSRILAKCSECDGFGRMYLNFCPNCGANMR